MKLYLSSYKFGDDPNDLASMFGLNKKVGVIFNAIDFSDDLARRDEGLKKEMDILKSLGLNPEEIDLRHFFGKKEELSKRLLEFGGFWVRGGNTFILRSAFKESGFDEWLVSNKNNTDLVYAGYSAGVCVLSPSLKGSDLVDDPNVFPEGYPREVVWDGLGIIDFAFAPHFESDHPESQSVNGEVAFYKENNIKYRALHDGEVIITQG